jgi:adenine phosphoribosyltransferase
VAIAPRTEFEAKAWLDGIRTIENWPKPGVMFKDITPLFQHPLYFKNMIDALRHRYAPIKPDVIAGIDARGFMLGAALAHAMGLGFVPIRKAGKLPFDTLREDYALEYGQASLEIHIDAFKSGDKVLLVDDLIATGGTMLAAVRLIERLSAEVLEACAIIDLRDLGGSARLRERQVSVYSLLAIDSGDDAH